MILVIGSTGSLGGAITNILIEQGKAVRILVRPNSDYQAFEGKGVEIVFGDLKEPYTLETACNGIETVITTANSALRGGADNIQTVEIAGNRSLIEAAKAKGVGHFIFVSALGASPSHLVPFLKGKGMTGEYVKESGLDYTILEPEIFMETWIAFVVGMPVQQDLPVTLVGTGQRKHTFVSARNVADYAVSAVTHPAARNQVLPIAGPQALTWLEVVEGYRQITGKPIRVNYVSPGDPVPGLPGDTPLMLAMMDTYDSVIDMDPLNKTFGVKPISLKEYIQAANSSQ